MFGNANPNTKMYITQEDPSLESHAGAQLFNNIKENTQFVASVQIDKVL